MNFCFDCDDTLYDMRSPFDQARAEVLPGLQADPVAFYTRTRAFSEEIFDQVQDGTLTVDQSGVLRIRKACEWWGQPVTLAQAEAFQAAYRRAQTEIRMAPELEEWLADTRSGLWILSNGPDIHQRRKFSALKTDRFFPESHTFTSGQIGFAKPDPPRIPGCDRGSFRQYEMTS